MKNAPAPRVLLVEDHCETRRVLRLYLEEKGFEVLEARRGDDGLDLATRRCPDVVLLDLMLPGMDGWTVCRRLRETSRVPILLLSARTLEEDRIQGFDLGADDYVCKPFSPREVVRRVQALWRRVRPVVDSRSWRVGELEMDLDSRSLRVAGRPVPLTATEFRILESLMRQPLRVFSRDQLVDGMSRRFDGNLRTVDAHVGNLRRKLAAAGVQDHYVHTVVGFGYRLTRP